MAYDTLTTVASLRAWLKQPGAGDDAELGYLIQVVSELIGRYCNRENLGSAYPYTENYFGQSGGMGTGSRPNFDLVLRHWPITTLVGVVMNNSSVPILTLAQLQSNASGVYVAEDNEPRIIKFRYLYRSYPITVTYNAGYAPGQVPWPLQQACNQYASEIFMSPAWIGRKSVSILNETISYDLGGDWGMSNRIMAMLKPYQDIVPFQGR